MNETHNPLQLPVPVKRSCWKKKLVCVLLLLMLGAGGFIALVHYCPWFARMQNTMTSQQMLEISAKQQEFETRLTELNARVDQIHDRAEPGISVPANKSENDTAAPSQKSAADFAHMQSDLVALSTAMNTLQDQVKQTGAHAERNQQATQGALASAIGFIQLREAAESGRSFTADLATMRTASKNDAALQEQLGKLEPYAAKGAPSLGALHETLIAQEAPAAQAIERANAQSWWQKILAEFKGLVSIRPLHGGQADAFGTMESDLAKGDLAGTLTAFQSLPPEGQQSLNNWKTDVEARQQVDEALHAIADHFAALANMSVSGEP